VQTQRGLTYPLLLRQRSGMRKQAATAHGSKRICYGSYSQASRNIENCKLGIWGISRYSVEGVEIPWGLLGLGQREGSAAA
jgi:hypothetical protein